MAITQKASLNLTKTETNHQSTLRTAHVCVCVSLCTTVVHNTAQNSSDSLHSYPPDNHLTAQMMSTVGPPRKIDTNQPSLLHSVFSPIRQLAWNIAANPVFSHVLCMYYITFTLFCCTCVVSGQSALIILININFYILNAVRLLRTYVRNAGRGRHNDNSWLNHWRYRPEIWRLATCGHGLQRSSVNKRGWPCFQRVSVLRRPKNEYLGLSRRSWTALFAANQ